MRIQILILGFKGLNLGSMRMKAFATGITSP